MGLDYLILEVETRQRLDQRLREARQQTLVRNGRGVDAGTDPRPDPPVVGFFTRLALARLPL
jgi:hypothetical protein